MRHATLLPLLIAAAAACDRSPTAPAAEPLAPTPPALTPASPGAPAWLSLSPATTFASNTPSPFFEYDNLPRLGLSSTRAVWTDMGPSSTRVRGYDFTGGGETVFGTTDPGHIPATAGRYSVWEDTAHVLWLRVDGETGQRRIASNVSRAVVSPKGWVAYQLNSGNLVLYRTATQETRVLGRYTTVDPQRPVQVVLDMATDGDLVAWTVSTAAGVASTVSLEVLDAASGEQRRVAMLDGCCTISGVSASAGRVAWIAFMNRRADVHLYDWAAGTERRVTPEAAKPVHLSLSGELLVVQDYRNDPGGRYVDSDIYLYDLLTGTELAVATGANDQEMPAVAGNRVVWAELSGHAWQLRSAMVQRIPSIGAVSAAVQQMRASGDIADDQAAQVLLDHLAAAAQAEGAGDGAASRAALQRFRQQVVAWSGSRIAAPAAAQLAAMVDAITPVFHAG